MSYKFTLQGIPVPKKNNRVTLKNGVTVPNAFYIQWHKGAMADIVTQDIPSEPIKKCSVKVDFTFGDFRKRDMDNCLNSVMDLLVDADIIQDDKWEVVGDISLKADYAYNEPKTVIEVIPDEDEEA